MQESELKQRIAELIWDGAMMLQREGNISCNQIADRILELFHDRTVPDEYLKQCDCHDWTARLPDMVFRHKPACPKHDPRYELALLADDRHQANMQKIREASDR